MTVKTMNPIFEKLGMKYPIVEGGMTWAGTVLGSCYFRGWWTWLYRHRLLAW